MEEQDQVNHREAVLGLSALGALLLALVGTIFYRIVNPLPPAKVSLDSLVIAPEPGGAAAPLATAASPRAPADGYRVDVEVSAANFGAEVAQPAAPAGPRFTAPGEAQ